MKISTSYLLATEKFLKLNRFNCRLTGFGDELLSLVQNEIVRRANESMAEYRFMARYRQLLYYKKLPIKKAKKKAHKIRHVYPPRKIRLCKKKGLNRYLMKLNGRRKK